MKKLSVLIMSLYLMGCASQVSEELKKLDASSFAAKPEVMTLKIKGYQPQPGHIFQNLFVSNFSVTPQQGQLLLSSSRDGLSDQLKQQLTSQYGFSHTGPESAVAGFADLLLFRLGLTIPQQTFLSCSDSLKLSSSNDGFIYNDNRVAGNPAVFLGLRDCQKLRIGLDAKKFDYDVDGIPDYLELRCGLNPANKNDAYLSTSGDGVMDMDKCKRHIRIEESFDTQPNQLFAYQYSNTVQPDGSRDLTVANISLLNGGEENFIAVYLIEIDQQTKAPSLYTAFAVLKKGYADQTLNVEYWAKTAGQFVNQEIVVP